MTILAAGTYRAKSIGAALGATKTGKEQVAVKFVLTAEGNPHLTWYGYFTDKTTDSTWRALRTAGWKGTDLADLSDLNDGAEVDVVVEHELDQNGVERARIRWVNDTGGMGLSATLDPAKAKVFAAKMRGKLAAYDRGAGSTPPPPSTPRGGPAPRAQSSVPQDVLDAQVEDNDPDNIPF
jgi:hypothetical protein